MLKTLTFRRGLSSVLFWSIISAAFIGPGTVTAAAKAGASFQLQLIWALAFSIVATMVLQEAAARITLASGKSLGAIIAAQYPARIGRRIRLGLFLAVAFGCAAYQAGNLLGAVSGLMLVSHVPSWALLLGIGFIGVGLLWQGNTQTITRLLAAVVAIMGVAFIGTAVLQHDYGLGTVALSAFQIGIPEGGALLVIGLIGTTIVPYNLFLASGISQGQSLPEMRWGITLAILIGGFISIAILIAGTQVEGAFTFRALADAVEQKLGAHTGLLVAFGLFAAGLSSAVTAPFAAAITARSLLETDGGDWAPKSRNFRLVWASIMGIGLAFGLLDVKPIPAIILAQAINGVLLPLVVAFLILAVNDRKLLSPQYANVAWQNILALLIFFITCFLGVSNLWKAASAAFPAWIGAPNLVANLIISLGITVAIAWRVYSVRP
ncbi:MAG: divalent metal cation transporter [Lewinellaceae bacterium]|nr:divalent metal cation transporter [Phaeodactylibacter sp.]MCB9038095.1 divalent metal cation transporter [Lewinellaceae bacterium]